MVIGHQKVDTRKRFHAVAQLSLLLGILASKTPLFFTVRRVWPYRMR